MCVQKYLPHEIIKKITWFIYHPKVIKFRLQVIHVFKNTFGMKESVDVKENGEGARGGGKRFTVAVNTMLDDVANDIIGKQVSFISPYLSMPK